jgi:hypothetical protein
MQQVSMIKIGANGEQLPEDATSWDAVLLPALGLMFTAGNVGDDEQDYEDTEAAVKALTVAGFSDWRIPERFELESILDLKRYSPAIDPVFFRDTRSDWYWTNTPCAWNDRPGPSGSVWVVDFGGGGVNYDDRNSTAFARAVRAVPAGQ